MPSAGTLYAIVNPSDPYTIRAQDHALAAVACLALGHGQYAFTPLDVAPEKAAELDVPLFIFGGADAWCRQRWGTDAGGLCDSVIRTRALDLADCLDSALIGSAHDRREYEARAASMSPETRAAWRAEWHERRRTSLNDIGARAYHLAARLRERAAAAPAEAAQAGEPRP